MKQYIASLITPIMAMSSVALADYDKDLAAISSMAGCYEVSFSYKETISLDPSKASRPYKNFGLEWIQLSEQENGSISLQHVLQIAPTFSIKHWRQEWHFEKPNGFEFQGLNKWAKIY